MEIKNTAVDLTDLAVGLVVLGIIVSIGVNILTTMRDSRLTSLDIATTTNESVGTVVDSATTSLDNVWYTSLTQCVNSSTGEVVPAANYTVTVDDFGVGHVQYTDTAEATGGFNGSEWKCTYSWYNTSRADYSTAHNATLGIAEYGNWFKIIVIVGIAAVVLSLIFMAFGGRGQSAEIGGGSIGGTY